MCTCDDYWKNYMDLNFSPIAKCKWYTGWIDFNFLFCLFCKVWFDIVKPFSPPTVFWRLSITPDFDASATNISALLIKIN